MADGGTHVIVGQGNGQDYGKREIGQWEGLTDYLLNWSAAR